MGNRHGSPCTLHARLCDLVAQYSCYFYLIYTGVVALEYSYAYHSLHVAGPYLMARSAVLGFAQAE